MCGVSTLPRKTSKLAPPSLSLSYASEKDNKYNSGYDSRQSESNTLDYGQHKFSHKNGSKSRFSVKSGDSGFEEMSKGDDVNLKNTKNKLNLQFAPDKINRPDAIEDSDADLETEKSESKISQEINGNFSKKESMNALTEAKSKLLENISKMEDEDDSSRSESEISVLELSSFIDLKENEKELCFDLNDEKSGSGEDSGGELPHSSRGKSSISIIFFILLSLPSRELCLIC